MHEESARPLKPEEKALSGLAYLLGFIPALIILLINKGNSPYVNFHAIQAAIFHGLINLLGTLLLAVQTAATLLTAASAFVITNLIADTISPETPGIYLVVTIIMIGAIMSGLLIMGLLMVGLKLVNFIAAFYAFSGRDWRYPVLAKWVDRIIKKDWALSKG